MYYMLKSLKKLSAASLVLSLLLLGNPALASADDCRPGDRCDEDGGLSNFPLYLVTSSIAGGVITVVGGGVTTTVLLAAVASDSGAKEAYLRQNAPALQQDMVVGAGDSIDDLAAAFHVSEENIPAFAAAVHAQRSALLPLTDVATLDEKRADAFFEIVAAAMTQTPALRADLQRAATPA